MKADVIPAVEWENVPICLKALDRLQTEIREAPSLPAAQLLADFATIWQRRWRPIKPVADRAGECWIEAELKIGEERAKVGVAKGTRGQLRGEGPSGRILSPPGKDAPTLKELQLSKRQAGRARKLVELGRKAVAALETELKTDERPITPHSVLALSRQKNKTAKKHKLATARFSADGPFDCVVIDPPWPMQKIDREVTPDQDAFDYPTMKIEELETFWPKHIAPKLSDDCHVFCWTTQKFLPATFDLLKIWKLKYVLVMVWHKAGGFQPVGLPQYNCEFVVYARKGAPEFISTKQFMVCFNAPRREHSRKPDLFYDLVRRVTGGSRIDIFSREKRKGFAQYGNEIEKFEGK